MLTAGGRAPLFGDPGKGATAAGADVGVSAQSANVLAGGSDGELDTEITEVEQSDQAHDAAQFSARKRVRHGADRGGGGFCSKRHCTLRMRPANNQHRKAPPGSAGRGVGGGGQLPFERRARDQMRLKVLPSSSANRLAKIGAVKLGSSSLIER